MIYFKTQGKIDDSRCQLPSFKGFQSCRAAGEVKFWIGDQWHSKPCFRKLNWKNWNCCSAVEQVKLTDSIKIKLKQCRQKSSSYSRKDRELIDDLTREIKRQKAAKSMKNGISCKTPSRRQFFTKWHTNNHNDATSSKLKCKYFNLE